MSKWEIHLCDCCGKRVDYYSEGDRHILGYTRHAPDSGYVELDVHIPTNCGYGGHRVPALHLDNICSPECLEKTVTDWLASVREIGKSQWGAVDLTSVKQALP
jgi:hypothetical protein